MSEKTIFDDPDRFGSLVDLLRKLNHKPSFREEFNKKVDGLVRLFDGLMEEQRKKYTKLDVKIKYRIEGHQLIAYSFFNFPGVQEYGCRTCVFCHSSAHQGIEYLIRCYKVHLSEALLK